MGVQMRPRGVECGKARTNQMDRRAQVPFRARRKEDPMSNAIQKAEERSVEFTPHGSQDKIKLTVGMVQRMVAVPTKSGRTCSERDAFKFIMLCRARRLDPFQGDAFLIGFDAKDGPQFSLITAHQAFLKRAGL